MDNLIRVGFACPRMDKNLVWKSVLERLKLNVSTGTFTTFLRPLSLGSVRDVDDERQLVEINCPSVFVRDTVEQRFWGQIKMALDETTKKKNELVIAVRAGEVVEKKHTKRDSSNPSGTITMFEERVADDGVKEKIVKAGLRETFTFEMFAVSSSNQMAHAATVAVTDKPGSAYNPLFLWGGVGVGKTHLMQAVGNALLRKGWGGRIVYCTGEEFTNDIVDGIRTKGMERVRERFRKVQLLLIDDIQFIAGKEAVQEEFFHTFNAVLKMGGQVVLTSDRQPHEISKLEDRLRSRFEAGLIVDISPPDFALRSAITLIKAEQKGLVLSTELAQKIAGTADSARKIEGYLVKLLTLREMEKLDEITSSVVERVVGETRENTNNKVLTPSVVLELVAGKFGVSVSQIKGGRRTAHLVIPRMVAMYLMRHDLKFAFEEIGQAVGGRDHSTVMHAVGKIEGRIEKDIELLSRITEIRRSVFGENGDRHVN